MNVTAKLAGALAVLAASFSGSTAIALQTDQQDRVTYFYTDESHTIEVGGVLVYCDGRIVRWGQYSLYSQQHYFGCD